MVLPTTEIIESFLYYTLVREQHHTLTTPQKLDIESLTFVVSLFSHLVCIIALSSIADYLVMFYFILQKMSM